MKINTPHIKPVVFCALLLMLALIPFVAIADTIPVQALQTAPRSVTLTWDSGYGAVDVSRQYPGETQYTVISSSVTNTFVDYQRRCVCDDTVRYIVTNGQDSGFAAAAVVDNEATAQASWGVVSTDHTTGQITLQWEPSPDTDILGYLVYEGIPSFVVDTVFGRLNTNYAYPPEQNCNVHQFRISALDSCRKSSVLTNSCNNIVVVIDNELCSRTYTATWNTYINMPSEVGSYELWASENNEPFQRKAIVEQQTLPSASFNVGTNCSLLKVYVRAISSDGINIALSHLVETDIPGNDLPQRLSIRRVSVEEPGPHVQLLATTDTGWQNVEFSIHRRSESSPSAEVGRCRPTQTGEIMWNDNGAKPDQAVYSYSLSVTDVCGTNTLRSNEASTILPVIEKQGARVNLSWNPYEGWEGTTSYNVYASSDGLLWQLVGNSATSWMPDVTDAGDGQKLFKVVALEGPDSHYRLNDSAQSATVQYRPHTDIWMPNAFTPLENSNKNVSPQAVYINPDGYSFSIYNRMGLLVFSTNDTREAWDGRSGGRLLPSGSYIYKITYLQSDGSKQQMTGTIMLIY